MTTETGAEREHRVCGCCGQRRPASRVHELGGTPGVYICSGCGLWAAYRVQKVSTVADSAWRLLRRLRPGSRRDCTSGSVQSVIPILASVDVNRTCAYYQSLGFDLAERHDGYLVMHSRGIEVHFSSPAESSNGGRVFVHVDDVDRLWETLRDNGVNGLSAIEDQPWGLREFVAVDPDGNRIRIGGPLRRH